MQEYHVVVYASQQGRTIHPEFVVERPNLSQDTQVSEYPLEEENLNVILWWMYDQHNISQKNAHAKRIIQELKLRLGVIEA